MYYCRYWCVSLYLSPLKVVLIFIRLAIVAETCSPFTVLPGLMNEYRIPELNVQNGVLKSMSFLFDYIGEIGKDFITPKKKTPPKKTKKNPPQKNLNK